MMKKTIIKVLSLVLLLSLTACSSNNQTVRFNEWNIIAPSSKLLYSYSDKERGFHGDGIDCYIYNLTPDYKDYIISLLEDQRIDLIHNDSTLDFSSDISYEIFQIDNNEIGDYFVSMRNIDSALVSQENDKLVILIDVVNERISFVFSLY